MPNWLIIVWIILMTKEKKKKIGVNGWLCEKGKGWWENIIN